ncbi:MAG: hypothetical protein ABJF04_16505 [Reichenbachiella sp.]|uniref:hypothetical protein n=1 Tax=Reichenbachiella sp. TaxID=2184521 RepID=UPI0032661056
MEDKEKKNRSIGIYASFGAHALLLLIFFTMLAWTEPDPPIPEYGIELNFGNELIKGSESDKQLDDEIIEEMEEVPEESAAESDDLRQTEQAADQDVESQNTETVPNETDKAVSEDINSPDIVEKKENTEVRQQEVIEETDESVSPETTESTETFEEKDEDKEQDEEPSIDDRAIYKKNDNTAETSSGGSSLDLAGWNWDFKPQPDDKSIENGIIIFQITIDEEGEIIGIKTLEKTVTPVVEKVYKDAVMELTFSKTSDNRVTAATSTGKITFIIQSK